MEIKRKTEMLTITSRRFVIRPAKTGETSVCETCGDATLTAEKSAAFFQINQRTIFQLIERGAAHFAETETGAVLICLASLAEALETESNASLTEKINIRKEIENRRETENV